MHFIFTLFYVLPFGVINDDDYYYSTAYLHSGSVLQFVISNIIVIINGAMHMQLLSHYYLLTTEATKVTRQANR